MDFELSSDEALIQKTARDFAAARILPVASANERAGRFPEEIFRELARLGLMAVTTPAALGGAGATTVAYSVAMTEVARACASTAVGMAVNNMVCEIVTRFGTDAQCSRVVPPLTGGEGVGAFALTEPHCGSDAQALRATARAVGDTWVLNGTKTFITNGGYALFVVAWAKTLAGISTFIVPRGAPGLRVGREEDKCGIRASNTVELHFEDCVVPREALLGDDGKGFRVAMSALDGGRIGVASQSLGIGLAATDAAAKYAKERTAFGRPIADFQAIAFMLADSTTELEASRLLTLRAARAKDSGQPFSRAAAMAKVFTTEAATRACHRAVQVHGGYGYIREFPVERYLRDVRVTSLYEGTSEIQRLVIARDLLRSGV
ncbi:MAG: acyl-CoA dehydrogenase family protein [Deltaproteobacteria bacterium]|nr:acyl-CoA dehydrogenase family protein [Deltaproteobacteria bacterium]